MQGACADGHLPSSGPESSGWWQGRSGIGRRGESWWPEVATCKDQEEGAADRCRGPPEAAVTLGRWPPLLNAKSLPSLSIHQESQVPKASTHHLLMFPNVLGIWKTDSFLEVAMLFSWLLL